MAFVSFDSAQGISIGSDGFANDGSGSNEASLVDNNTGTSASSECRAGMNCYKAVIDLGFPVANLDNSNLSIRIFDGTIMTVAGLCVLHPYTSINGVHASVSSVAAINDDAAYDEFLMPSAWVDELFDIGTNQIAVRFFASGSGRGRFNELQIEFFEAGGETASGGGTITPIDAAGTALIRKIASDGTPALASIEASGTALIRKIASDGGPNIAAIEAAGTAATGLIEASGNPSLTAIVAAGSADVPLPFPYHVLRQRKRDIKTLITM